MIKGKTTLFQKDPQRFIDETMKNWIVELTAGGKSLAKMKIQRDILQGDALSPSQFVIARMPPQKNINH